MSATQHAARSTHHISRFTLYVLRLTFDVSRSSLPLLALLLLAFTLRLHTLDFQPLWFDEGKSVFFANQTPWDTAILTAGDIHPPLYYWLLHSWAFLAGWSPFALRFLSVCLSLLAVPLIYRLGRLLSGRRLVGLLAALILALSPMHVYYAQEARMYALVATLGLASTVWLLRALGYSYAPVGSATPLPAPAEGNGGHRPPSSLNRSQSVPGGLPNPPDVAGFGNPAGASGDLLSLRRGVWLVYVAITAAALYTHYYAAFILLFQVLFVLLNARLYRSALRRWLVSLVVLGLLYTPWLIFSYSVLASYVTAKVAHEGYPPLPLWTYLADHLSAFSAGTLGDRPVPTIVCVSLAALGLLYRPKSKVSGPESPAPGPGDLRPATGDLRPASCILHPASCILLYLFIPLAAGFAINLFFPFHPPHYERQFLYAAPAFYLLMAFGLAGIPRFWNRAFRRSVPAKASERRTWLTRVITVGAAILALLAVVALDAAALRGFYTTPRYGADDYRPLLVRAQALAQPDDVVVCIYPWQVGYFQSYLRPPRPRLYYAPVLAWDDLSQMEADLADLLDDHPRLWFPSYQVAGRGLETRVETWLSRQAHIIEQGWHENNKLLFYASPRPLPAPAPGAQFGDPPAVVVLDEYQMAAGEFPSAWGVVRVRLRWHLLARTTERFLVTLRLADVKGRTWALSDMEPQAGLWPFSLWGAGETFDDRRALLIPAGTPPGAYNLYLSLHRAEGGQPLPVTSPDGARPGTELLLGRVNVITPPEPPPLAALPIQYPRPAAWGDVRLLGYSLGAGPLRAGQPAPVTLFWQAQRPPPGDYLLAVELRDEAGRNQARSTPRPLGDFYPTSKWRAGEFVVDQYEVTPAPGTSGVLRLTVAIYNAAGQSVGQPVTLQPVLVTGRTPSFAVPAIQYPMDVRFGDGVSLLGYQIAPTPGSAGAPGQKVPVQPGQTITLTLYWQCRAPLDRSYKVFTHLIDPDQPMNIQAQDDDVPGHGTAPTTGWVVGEVLTDTYTLVVKPETPSGTYYLSVGLYDPVTGARLPAFDAAGNSMGDHLLLRAVLVGAAYP